MQYELRRRRRRALLVYPEFPVSFWGLQHAVELSGKRSNLPPLGLLTIAAMFPPEYELRVVDLNVQPLSDRDLRWADRVFLSAMQVQAPSLLAVVARCRAAGVPTVAGGPFPSSYPDALWDVDCVVRGEVEGVFRALLAALEDGSAPRVLEAPARPSIGESPVPRYDLVDIHVYSSMSIQFSRGCPFDCEFCDITKLYGRVPRTKTPAQVVAEMESLYELGWRGTVFFVDDNFIGNRRSVERRLLPEVARWQRERGYPFAFYTEASVNLANMDALMGAMVDAGFFRVFLGIETPNADALRTANKKQNVNGVEPDYLLHAVSRIHGKGLQVMAGFILGMDGDGEESFDAQIDFIQRAGIPMAMIGLLTALRGTNLYQRLEREGRLLDESSGSNMATTLNFVPELPADTLERGFVRVLRTLYDPGLESYFERCWTQLEQLPRGAATPGSLRHWSVGAGASDLRSVARSVRLQFFSRQGRAYARFMSRVIARRPRLFGQAITLAICGYHFEKLSAAIAAGAVRPETGRARPARPVAGRRAGPESPRAIARVSSERSPRADGRRSLRVLSEGHL